jgi:hypothetical protein
MYVYVCNPCLDENHIDCEESTWKRDGVKQVGYGGGACVCSHTPVDVTPFEEHTRARSAKSREAKMADITIIEVDDWVQVYKDGKTVWANHSCPLREGLEALGIPFEHKYYDDGEYDDVTIELPDGSDVFPEELPND